MLVMKPGPWQISPVLSANLEGISWLTSVEVVEAEFLSTLALINFQDWNIYICTPN